MPPWSLVSVQPDADGAPHLAALVNERLFTLPALPGLTGDLADVVACWSMAASALRSVDPREGAPLEGARILAPLRTPGKLICAGANYTGHLREMGISSVPSDLEPYFFLLPRTSIIGPGESVVLPDDPDASVDWEAELAVVIGTGGRDIAEDAALEHVAGYTIMNDISARGHHRRANPLAPPFAYDWLSSKGLDTFSPLGPSLTPAWAVPDVQDLTVRLWRNGKLEQDGSTADMIFSVTRLISAASRTMTLEPGDVIATGTPAGVGVAQGKSLADGDVLRIEIGALGALENTVHVRAAASAGRRS
ncbi:MULTISPECIES: fumarylacetoacetate hydrolase family protein [Streptomyces violaceusniger group]|uniref:Fumarylacetoacetate hydrolase family protein n=2 Tax=Streptomyces rhizosphaericus TaxID=114699 RepID=A0ABN1NS17_9ACTN|nr:MULTISPECIES: fumarylacetoacetate hydrolase family protein [Streptomyces violaceusniger group]